MLKNLVILALILGIVAGIWLGDLFKGLGFGLGPGLGGGSGAGTGTDSPGNTSAKPAKLVTDDSADLVGYDSTDTISDSTASQSISLVKVLIDDREYFIRRGEKTLPIGLDALVTMIEGTKPNEDGLKAVVDRTATSRVSAEVKLFDALKAAGVQENSVYLAPQSVD